MVLVRFLISTLPYQFSRVKYRHVCNENISIWSVNTLTANYVYSRSNRQKLPLPLQIQLPKKPKVLCEIFIAFLESTLNFEHSEKKNDPSSPRISEVIDSKRRAYLNE